MREFREENGCPARGSGCPAVPGAPPLLLPLRLLPTPFPVPLSSARRRQDEAPTGVSYVPTRSPCACTRWLSAQLDGLILPGCPAPAWTARGSGGASVPRSRHAPSPARSTEHGVPATGKAGRERAWAPGQPAVGGSRFPYRSPYRFALFGFVLDTVIQPGRLLTDDHPPVR